jgi:NADH dehydrogenase ubiquinone Fe-S protein 4
MAQTRIFRPAKNAMQSGRGQLRKWVLEYEPVAPRRPDPLMGWAVAEDTLDQVSLRFATLDEARAFAEKRGLDYTVITPHDEIEKPKSYADNFRYDKVRG